MYHGILFVCVCPFKYFMRCLVNVYRKIFTLVFHNQINGFFHLKTKRSCFRVNDIIAMWWVIGIRAGQTFQPMSCESVVFLSAFCGCLVECLMFEYLIIL